MPNVPRLFDGTVLAVNELGTSTIHWLNGFDGVGDPIGNNLGANSTEESNGFQQNINRVVKYNGNLFCWVRDKIRKYDPVTGNWDVVHTFTDMQKDGLPDNWYYTAHSGMFIGQSHGSPSGLILVAFYNIDGSYATTAQPAAVWSYTGEAGTWFVAGIGTEFTRARWGTAYPIGTKIYTTQGGAGLLVFDCESKSLKRMPTPGGVVAVSPAFVMYRGKLLCVSPSANSRWGLFEWNGLTWIPVYTAVNAQGDLVAGQPAYSGTGQAAAVVINSELFLFCPTNGSPNNYIFKVVLNAGVWSVTDVTNTMIGTTYTNSHGAFPSVTNGRWYSHLDNWTNIQVYYMWYQQNFNSGIYIFRNNGDGEEMDPLFVTAGTAAALLQGNTHNFSACNRGGGEYTLGEEDQPDQGDTVQLLRTERRPDTGYRRIYFKVKDGQGLNGAYRLRLLFDTGQANPTTVAGNLKAIGGGNGTPTIAATGDYIDGVVGDGVEQWIDWDDSGILGESGKISLAIVWRVA